MQYQICASEEVGTVNSLSALTTLGPDIPFWQTPLGSTLLDLIWLQAFVIPVIPFCDILRDCEFSLVFQALFLRGSKKYLQCNNGTFARRGEDVY